MFLAYEEKTLQATIPLSGVNLPNYYVLAKIIMGELAKKILNNFKHLDRMKHLFIQLIT